tara:strand:+ start:310 stop:441 length:132 start_codon:yes stop_codon:yes gene_type:complete
MLYINYIKVELKQDNSLLLEKYNSRVIKNNHELYPLEKSKIKI